VDAYPLGGGFFQETVQPPGIELFDQALRRSQVADPGKTVVSFFVAQAGVHHLPLQPFVASAVEPQPEGRPGGYAQGTESPLSGGACRRSEDYKNFTIGGLPQGPEFPKTGELPNE
jgi:hypothetical protein